jgi:hypothetical protein
MEFHCDIKKATIIVIISGKLVAELSTTFSAEAKSNIYSDYDFSGSDDDFLGFCDE